METYELLDAGSVVSAVQMNLIELEDLRASRVSPGWIVIGPVDQGA